MQMVNIRAVRLSWLMRKGKLTMPKMEQLKAAFKWFKTLISWKWRPSFKY